MVPHTNCQAPLQLLALHPIFTAGRLWQPAVKIALNASMGGKDACFILLRATRLPDSATVRSPSVMTGLLPKGCTAFSSLGATMVCTAMNSRSLAGLRPYMPHTTTW